MPEPLRRLTMKHLCRCSGPERGARRQLVRGSAAVRPRPQGCSGSAHPGEAVTCNPSWLGCYSEVYMGRAVWTKVANSM